MGKPNIRRLFLMLALLCLVPLAGCGLWRGEIDAATQAAIDGAMDAVYPALVRVDVVSTSASGGRMRKTAGSGSGAIISKEGHVVTNHHVASGAARLICRMPDGEEIEADLIGTDALADIAVLKLKLHTRKEQKPLPVATFGDSDKMRVGDMVLAMGSPGGMTQSVTKGIVCNTTMMAPSHMNSAIRLDGENTGSLVRWIGHDAQIYGGNSGGPLVNLKGEIIGINEVSIAGLAGAIPSNLAKEMVEQILDTGVIKRSWIGLECQPRLKNSKEEKGILVSGVIKDSPAEKAGIEAGDVLTAYNGVAVDARLSEDLPVFNAIMFGTKIGETVKLSVARDGESKEFSVTTLDREKARGEDSELKPWGITARDFTPMSAIEMERPDEKGVLVSSTRSGGPSSEAKPSLYGGDVIRAVNGETVENVKALQKITEKLTDGDEKRVSVLVSFARNRNDMLTVVKIGKSPKSDTPFLSRKAWLPLDFQVMTRDLAESLGLAGKPGVRVTRIFPGHSAEKAGLKVGDILLKLDGQVINASREEDHEVLPTMIRQYKIGTEADMSIVRDGKAMKIAVELESPQKPTTELKRYKDDYFELTVRELSFNDRMDRNLEEDAKGVLIETVEPAGWAQLAELNPGDLLLNIDGEEVLDVDQVETILTQARKDKARRVAFFVRRGIHTLFLEIELDWNGKNGK